MSARPTQVECIDRKESCRFESYPTLAFFEAQGALRQQWLPLQGKPEDKFRSQCRSKNQSSTSLCPLYFSLALRGYRPPDKHPHNLQRLHKHSSLWYEPLRFLPLNVLSANIAKWLLYKPSLSPLQKCAS
jgi:hypothetical protein